jgi:hypothetical protein
VGINGAMLAYAGEETVKVLCAGEGGPCSKTGLGRPIGLADPLVGLSCGGSMTVKVLFAGDICSWYVLGPGGWDAVTAKVLRAGEGKKRSVVGLALEGMVVGGGGN